MAGWDQTIIVGNVGRDPELRYTQAGVAVCDFSVAVTKRLGRDDAGNAREKTTWYKVTCWRQQAEIAAQYVTKGKQIMVVGSVDASAYVNKQGNAAASLELTADRFELLGGRGDGEPAHASGAGEEVPF